MFFRYSFFLLIFICVFTQHIALGFAFDFPIAAVKINVKTEDKDSNQARRVAIDQAHLEAFYQVIEEKFPLVRGIRNIRRFNVDDIPSLVSGYQFDNEKISGTGYEADITVSFDLDVLRRFLESKRLLIGKHDIRPILVIPYYSSYSSGMKWDVGNLWWLIWSRLSLASDGVIVVPFDSRTDIDKMAKKNLGNFSYEDISLIASNYKAREVRIIKASSIFTREGKVRLVTSIDSIKPKQRKTEEILRREYIDTDFDKFSGAKNRSGYLRESLEYVADNLYHDIEEGYKLIKQQARDSDDTSIYGRKLSSGRRLLGKHRVDGFNGIDGDGYLRSSIIRVYYDNLINWRDQLSRVRKIPQIGSVKILVISNRHEDLEIEHREDFVRVMDIIQARGIEAAGIRPMTTHIGRGTSIRANNIK